jgi:hypothetical protein
VHLFYIDNYKNEVSTMLDYIQQWSNKSYGSNTEAVVSWLQKRVNRQDISSVRLIEIVKLLSDSTSSDYHKVEDLRYIIQEDKLERMQAKQAQAKAEIEHKKNVKKQQAKQKKEKQQWERNHIKRLVRDTLIITSLRYLLLLL